MFSDGKVIYKDLAESSAYIGGESNFAWEGVRTLTCYKFWELGKCWILGKDNTPGFVILNNIGVQRMGWFYFSVLYEHGLFSIVCCT